MQNEIGNQWAIEPELQEFMERKMVIARGTFAKDINEEVLRNTVLLHCAGMGLARAENRNGGTRWVRTELLVELEKEPSRPVDLTPFMAMDVTTGDNLPCMTESLRLIIADMIALGSQPHDGQAEQNAVDVGLLMLAGGGLASIAKDQDDNWIWCANPALIGGYQMGGGKREPKLILDEILEGVLKALNQLVELQIGCKMPKRGKRMSTIVALVQHELNGLAVAYKDPKGRLAWKASAELEREFNAA